MFCTQHKTKERIIYGNLPSISQKCSGAYLLLVIPCIRMEEDVISSLLMRNPKLRNVDCSAKYPCTGWRMMIMMMVMMIMMATIMRNRS